MGTRIVWATAVVAVDNSSKVIMSDENSPIYQQSPDSTVKLIPVCSPPYATLHEFNNG